jgi:hypothetical protein
MPLMIRDVRVQAPAGSCVMWRLRHCGWNRKSSNRSISTAIMSAYEGEPFKLSSGRPNRLGSKMTHGGYVDPWRQGIAAKPNP